MTELATQRSRRCLHVLLMGVAMGGIALASHRTPGRAGPREAANRDHRRNVGRSPAHWSDLRQRREAFLDRFNRETAR
jgi:hypothetical protein